MVNIGKEILERQNQEESLVLLLAQREIYSSAKKLQFYSIILVAFIPVILAMIGYFNKDYSSNYTDIIIIYSVIATFGEFFLNNLRDNKKSLASSIQENFDTKVFKIKKNKNLGVLDVDDDILFEYKSKIQSGYNIDKLRDWYSHEIAEIKTNIAILFCQRTNVSYDYNLRKRYIKCILVLLIVVSLLLLFFGFSKNMTLIDFSRKVIVPMLPIFIFSFNEIKNQYEAINTLKELQYIFSKNLENITLDSCIDKIEIRQIQDRIYRNRRVSPLIFDFIYHFLRDRESSGLEQIMHFSISSKIKELKEQENQT